jgi:hypothetical protein
MVIKMNRSKLVEQIQETGRTTDVTQALESLVLWGNKAQYSTAKEIRWGRGSQNPKDACKICSSVVLYIINTYPELSEIYTPMHNAGTETGCEACLDMLEYSKTLLQDIKPGTGGDYEERQELLDQIEKKYNR